MRNLLVRVALLTSLLFLASPVRAQAEIHLTSASIDLWPEYDQPGVLVIYHVQLAQNTTLPASMVFHIPASAQVNAVAEADATKGLINVPYQSTIQGDQSALTVTSNSLQIQLEYYVGLTKDGTTRHIVYDWPGDYPVDALDVNFLLPPAADQLKITPPPVTSGPGQGGLTNYLVRTANLPAGNSFSVTIEYQRQTDELSIASLPVQAISTPGANTPGLTSSPTTLQWALGGLGMLMIVGGAIGFVNWRKGGRKPARSYSREVSSNDESKSEAVYCSECGKRAQPGDMYCRTCGAKLSE